jgi:serine/threonine protein kinase
MHRLNQVDREHSAERFAFDEQDRVRLIVREPRLQPVGERVLGVTETIAPEQARDSTGVDCRADIYSLGCVLFYVLAGRPVFPGPTLAATLMAHQTEPPADLGTLRSDVPQDLVRIVGTMLAKSPADRFPSADALRQVLDDWLSEHPEPDRE